MQNLKDQLKKVIQDLYGLDFEPEITPSPDNIDADYSTNVPLKLARELKKPPMKIADELMEEFKNNAFEEHIWQRAKCGATEARNDGPEGAFRKSIILNATPPGFINFTLPDSFLNRSLENLNKDFEGSIALNDYENKTVICEFSDPNPFKVLHVGHLYTSIVGDSIARLFEYAGANVIRANFGGDVGLHVAKTMYALINKDTDNLKIEDIARCYIEGTALYEEDEKAKQEITKLNKEIYKINAAGEPKKVLSRERSEKESFSVPRLTELYWKGRELSYEYFDQFYDSIGVKFDKYYPESTVANLGLEKVKEQLKNGIYEMSDGAVIFNGEKYGLHTRVFINKEGIPTYEAKDVGLIFTKWQDYHFDKSVVITGNEQLDYMKVVLKSVEQYAPELVKNTTHLTHGLVKLPGGVKMSSRKGNFLKAIDVLDMVREELKNEYNSEDENIALAATKYAFLKYKMGGNIIFDPKESVKMTGNSGPYLLYSCVRAKNILAKSELDELQNTQRVSIRDNGSDRRSEPCNDRPLGRGRPSVDRREQGGERMCVLSSSERRLIKKLLEYRLLLAEAVTEMAPHKVANYLYELAQSFSRFYENCPVVGSDHEQDRLKLVKIYLETMTHGLGILGINIPEEM